MSGMMYIWSAVVLLCVSYPASSEKKDLRIISEYKPPECNEFADEGDQVLVHYKGALESGQVFDSSKDKDPLPFVLGEGRVIQGWERGIKGMCPGEKRKLIIPAHLGYGERGYPPLIPPDATLIFDTELVGLQKKSVGDQILPAVQMLAMPAAFMLVIYYLYQKYQQAPTKKDIKKEQREERRSRRKRK